MTRVTVTRQIDVRDPSAVPAWLTGKSLLTWYSLPGTAVLNAMTGLVSDVDYYGSRLGIHAYCGIAFKEAGSVLMHVASGGHNDYTGNEVYQIALNSSAPAWQRLRMPTKLADAGYYIGPGGPPGAAYYADGRPSSRHTYSHNQFIAARNRVFMFGAAAVAGNGNGSFPVVDAFNLATNDYDAAGSWQASGVADFGGVNNPTVKDSAENVYKFIKNTGVLLKWTQATATWSTLYTDVGQAFTNICHDPARNRILRISVGSACYYDLNSSGAKTAISFSGSAAGSVTGAASTIWCPDRNKFLHLPFYQSSTIIEIDPISFACSTLSVSGTPPFAGTTGYEEWNSRFRYIPELKIVVLLPRADNDIGYFRVA